MAIFLFKTATKVVKCKESDISYNVECKLLGFENMVYKNKSLFFCNIYMFCYEIFKIYAKNWVIILDVDKNALYLLTRMHFIF